MNIVGIDEVGHGAIAGPVAICAYMSDSTDSTLYYRDSKGLSRKNRLAVEPIYREIAMEYYVVFADNFEVDRTSALHARNLAIDIALRKFQNPVDQIIMDGDHLISEQGMELYKGRIIYEPGADKKIWQCAAASILAKNDRDRFMSALGDQYSVYGWKNNVGYSDPGHLNAITRHGASPYHRKTNSAVQAALNMS